MQQEATQDFIDQRYGFNGISQSKIWVNFWLLLVKFFEEN